MIIDDKIELKSSIFEVEEILQKTKARGWQDLKVGDIIQFSMVPNAYHMYGADEIWTVRLNDLISRWENKQALFYSNVSKFRLKEIQPCP